MKNAVGRIVLALGLAVAVSAAVPPETVKDQALKAFHSGDYSKVVRLCQEALRSTPEDEELLFLMSRAYAFDSHFDWALQTLDTLTRRSPKNTDYLIFRATIELWRNNVSASKAGYDEVLSLAPGNPEALAGLGRIAARKGDDSVAERYFLGSLARDSKNPEVHYELGNVYLRQGAFAKARASFLIAREIDPKTPDYTEALTRSPGRTAATYEFLLSSQPENFTDGRTSFQSGQAAFVWHLPKNGPALVLKGDRTHRYGLWDTQFGIECYPRLWKGGSAYLDLNASPGGADLYPTWAGLLEIYQALSGSWDASLGYRFMKFPSNPVSIYFGSLGVYVGPFYSCARVYYSPKSAESKISWLFLTRWYFNSLDYLYGGYGRGTRSMEITAAGDLYFKNVETAMVGISFTLFGRLHLAGSFSRLNDRNVGRNTWSIGVGYMWGE